MKILRCFLLLAGLGALDLTGALAHDHLAAGVSASNQLQLIGASISGTTNSRIYHLVQRPVGQNYGGYYSLDEFPRSTFTTDYFTFIAWSDGQTQLDGPEMTPTGLASHAPTGTDVWMEIVSVTGPAGAHFGFWESGVSSFQNVPTQSFLTNTSTGSYKFEISEPIPFDPPSSQDPYGHIHNRGWTADQPGTYLVGFRLRDESHLGAGGGPLAATSGIYTFTFIAVPEPGSAVLILGGAVVLASWRRMRNV